LPNQRIILFCNWFASKHFPYDRHVVDVDDIFLFVSMAFNNVDALNACALVRESDDRNKTIHRDHYDELLA